MAENADSGVNPKGLPFFALKWTNSCSGQYIKAVKTATALKVFALSSVAVSVCRFIGGEVITTIP